MLRRIIGAGIAGVVASSHAFAADKTMPINFVGDWCHSNQDGRTISYQLPSWTEGGRCTQILSITPEGFYGQGRHCEPVNIRVTRDTKPSGTRHFAIVTARCQPDGPVTAGEIQIFEFSRYKGNLDVTRK
jgi:hypothetical protein